MTITVEVDFGKQEISNFQDLLENVCQASYALGREMLRQALERLDDKLLAERDAARYRCKGFQRTCVKTILGATEFKRRVYVDNAAVEGTHCVHLLDEALGMEKIGLVASDVCRLAAAAACESNYRSAAKTVSEATGLSISPQGVWNLVQKMGRNQAAVMERHAELAQMHKGTGVLSSEILYEEDDGIWLKLQGASRKEYGASKEMKVGIAYDGVLYQTGKSGPKRRTLDNKVAYASFSSAEDFERNKEGLVASRFRVEDIRLRVSNGDGANWIRKKQSKNGICTLDAFHRNKKITECVKNPEFAQLLRTHLQNKDIPALLACMEAQINSTDDESERNGLLVLQRYYTENQENLLGYYDRGIEIPETRAPGVVHHARLGSMEGNVFTLIGNRMKGRRACWSFDGANNLALLLCLQKTTGFSYLFAKPAPMPTEENEPVFEDVLPIFGASKVPEREGHGYEFWANSCTAIEDPWIRSMIKSISFGNGNNF